MKVSFSVPLVPKSGKQVFACRLAESLRKKGIKVTDKRPNINLVIVKGTKPGCRNVLRLDGIWMNNRVDCNNKNRKILDHLNNCEGIVYQNEFCKKASDIIVGKTPKPYAIIGNGIDPLIFRNRKKFRHPKPFFMAMCNWRPHKRLRSIVKGFIASGLTNDYDLIVFGNVEKKIKHKSVIYLGSQENKALLDALVYCVATVHLAYIDWCPNSVVESIVAGKPVLHTDSGGTKLIVKDNGVRIKESRNWDFSIVDLYDPPKLSNEEIGEGYRKLLELPKTENRPDLYIDHVADQYISFFRRVIDA